MPMSPRQTTLAVLLVLAACLSGCAPHNSGPSKPTRNTLRYPMVATPTTFDPAMVQDGTTIDLLQNVFEGLVQWSPQNTIVPALAQSWNVSPDGLTYTFHLRPGVKFQDGHPFTAADVYYSFRRALDPKLGSPVALEYMGDIKGAHEENAGKTTSLTGVKVVDQNTVAITITRPKAYWLDTLTYPTSYIVSRAEATGTAPLTDALDAQGAGTGPFQITQYQPDYKVTLKANPAYWDGPPKLAGIERPIIKDAGTRHSEYVSGNIDMLQYMTQGDLQSDLRDTNLKAQIHYFPRTAMYYIGLNERVFPAFKDIRVRQALAYATDKQKIRHVVLHDLNTLAQDILPEGIPGYDPKFQGLPYDPVKARALLAQAGYPGGKGFPVVPITYRESYPDIAKTADLIRAMWQDNLGITVQPRQTEWGAMLQRQDANSLEAFHTRWSADYLDPQDYYSMLLRSGATENHVGYSNPQFDALCDAADIDQNPTRRAALYRRAARIAADQVPMIPLYYQRDIELIRPYVTHIDDSLMGHLPYKHCALTP